MRDPVKVFEWKDRQGNFHKVTEMETRHLYYTLLMMWNHLVPEHMQLRPFKRYKFGKFYTVDYIKEAVYQLSQELLKRRNVPQRWLKELREIHTFIKSDDVNLLK